MVEVDTEKALLAVAPQGWGDDLLSEFISRALQNSWATFDNKKELVQRLVAVDWCFARISKDWLNPNQNILSCVLFIRCHGAFRTAAGLAMSGQIAESAVVLRLCLEYAASALRIDRNEDLAAVFMTRHDSDTMHTKSRNEFKASRLKEEVKKASGTVSQNYNALYEELIDFGAHPNEKAISASGLHNDLSDGSQQLGQILLHEDGVILSSSVLQVYKVGICALEINELIFRSRYELFGVRKKIFDMKNRRDFSAPKKL